MGIDLCLKNMTKCDRFLGVMCIYICKVFVSIK